MFMRVLVASLAALSVGGCAHVSSDTRVGSTPNASPAGILEARARVAITDTVPADAKSLGTISAARCHRNTSDTPPTEETVKDDLRLIALAGQADGISGVEISKTSALSQNCWYLLRGQATAYSKAVAEQDALVEELNALKTAKDAGQINEYDFSRKSLLITQKAFPEDAALDAYMKYRVFISKQLSEKKIGREEFDYRNAEKWAAYRESIDRANAMRTSVQTSPVVVQSQPDWLPFVFLTGAANAINRAYPAPAAPVNCVSTSLGNTVNTNCY